MRRYASAMVTLAALLLTAGCSVTSSSTRYHAAPALAPAGAEDVLLYTRILEGNVTELGEVRVEWSGTRLEYGLLADPEVQSGLKAEAAKLGANGVMFLRPVTVPGGVRSRVAGHDTPLIKGVVGTAVRIQ